MPVFGVNRLNTHKETSFLSSELVRHERVISSKLIYKGKMIDVRRDEVILPSSKKAQREIVEHQGSVSIVGLVGDGRKVLLLRHFRVSIGRTIWEIPAGVIDEGERPEQTARRELMEETGYAAKTMKPIFRSYPTPGYSSELMHCFLATSLTKSKGRQLDNDEGIEVKPIGIRRAFRMIRSGEITDGKTIAALSYLIATLRA